MHWLPVRPFSSQGELLDLAIFLRKKFNLSDQNESWPGPQSRVRVSWGCELGYCGADLQCLTFSIWVF